MRKRPEFAREMLAVLKAAKFAAWAGESRSLAWEHVYRKGAVRSGESRKDGPVLPEGYIQTAKAVAERRVVVAGYRLADTLRGRFGE